MHETKYESYYTTYTRNNEKKTEHSQGKASMLQNRKGRINTSVADCRFEIRTHKKCSRLYTYAVPIQGYLKVLGLPYDETSGTFKPSFTAAAAVCTA